MIRYWGIIQTLLLTLHLESDNIGLYIVLLALRRIHLLAPYFHGAIPQSGAVPTL